MLCAVLRAILRPAALVAEGCFFLDAAEAVLAEGACVLALAAVEDGGDFVGVMLWSLSPPSMRGCICIILRDRVGGGGKAKALLAGPWVAEDLRRALTVSAGCITEKTDVGEICSGDGGMADDTFDPPSGEAMAGGGSSNAVCSDVKCFVPSFPGRSVDEAGVGRNAARGMLSSMVRTPLDIVLRIQ